MTEKEMHKLADIIIDKLVEKQMAHDDEFRQDLAEMMKENPGLEIGEITQQELIEQELNFLQDLLKEQEEKENYRDASITLIKIEKFKKKYNL
tara:strand:- start:2238 stop:2516 length:279 start_codon:yes stop_codon:yes gene_type:complete